MALTIDRGMRYHNFQLLGVVRSELSRQTSSDNQISCTARKSDSDEQMGQVRKCDGGVQVGQESKGGDSSQSAAPVPSEKEQIRMGHREVIAHRKEGIRESQGHKWISLCLHRCQA